jgi:hypothetical protein
MPLNVYETIGLIVGTPWSILFQNKLLKPFQIIIGFSLVVLASLLLLEPNETIITLCYQYISGSLIGLTIILIVRSVSLATSILINHILPRQWSNNNAMNEYISIISCSLCLIFMAHYSVIHSFLYLRDEYANDYLSTFSNEMYQWFLPAFSILIASLLLTHLMSWIVSKYNKPTFESSRLSILMLLTHFVIIPIFIYILIYQVNNNLTS